ncbi:MAG TPA: helix-hairpin-helix domain-containing protein [Blastocatellia bacterium]|nr:helix-hairpin-helix domain-containing protein [Blastocatellia bacterium]
MFYLRLFSILLSIAFIFGQANAQTDRLVVVAPLNDKDGKPIERLASTGATYPVFAVAPNSPLLESISGVLNTPFPKQVLKLERSARNLRIKELASQNKEAPQFTGPLYLLLSNEEGGYARQGFWLRDLRGDERFVPAGYVDLIVDARSVKQGDFEEIFTHELAHLILRTILGPLPLAPSCNMHQSIAITDYPTAFDEGYAEHFQPLVRDHTENLILRRIERGADLTDLNVFWNSNVDRLMRNDGVRRNLLVYEKALPALALEPDPDRHRLFLDGETSTAFILERFKNGQQMMSSEGVVAAIFYRFVNDERIQNRYRDGRFYERFLSPQSKIASATKLFSPYENANLKLFAAMREMCGKPLTADRPLTLELVQAYGRIFPDEKQAAYEIFINTTFGATMSKSAVAMFEQLAMTGRMGDLQFAEQLPEARKFLQELVKQAATGTAALDAQIGQELWVLNSDFKIGQSLWDKERAIPLAINLNTATIPVLMTLPGVDLPLAQQIISARVRQGYFKSMDDLSGVKGIAVSLIETLKAMQKRMNEAVGFHRK